MSGQAITISLGLRPPTGTNAGSRLAFTAPSSLASDRYSRDVSEPDLYTRINAALDIAFEADDLSALRAAIGEPSRGLDGLVDDEAARLIVLNGLATSFMQLSL